VLGDIFVLLNFKLFNNIMLQWDIEVSFSLRQLHVARKWFSFWVIKVNWDKDSFTLSNSAKQNCREFRKEVDSDSLR
jgi:hypothetical protein